jgi:ADP-heptose:LPS heptosyltransferase
MGFPVFSDLSAPRCAALIARSAGIISGKSVFFELANMLSKPVIGIFQEKERAFYCQESALTKAVTYSTTPDSGVVEKVVLFVNNVESMRKA